MANKNSKLNNLNDSYAYVYDGFEEKSNVQATKIFKHVKHLDSVFKGVNSKNFNRSHVLYAIELFQDLPMSQAKSGLEDYNFALDYVIESFVGVEIEPIKNGKMIQVKVCPTCRSKAQLRTNGNEYQIVCENCDCKTPADDNIDSLLQTWDYQKSSIEKYHSMIM